MAALPMILALAVALCLTARLKAEANLRSESLADKLLCDCPVWTAVPPKGVNVEVPKFAGRWYEVWTTFGIHTTFEKDITCVTADYFSPSVTADGLVSWKFVNNGNKDSPSGALVSDTNPSQGTITQACMCASGKFEVAIEGVDKTGQYIVYKTGPVTDGLYDYAVVTTPLGILGWIFARDPAVFKATQESDLLEELKAEGFKTPFNSFSYATYQGAECNYGPLPVASV